MQNKSIRIKKKQFINKLFLSVFFSIVFISYSSPIHSFAADKKSAIASAEETEKDKWAYSNTVKGLTFRLSYGFENEARYGRNLNLYIEIQNPYEAFTGTISAILIGDTNKVKYSTKVEVMEQAVTKKILTLPMNHTSQQMQIRLSDNDDKIIIESEIKLNVTNFGTYKTCGILSDQWIRLSYFKGFGTKCYYLTKDNFPSDKMGLDMLDMLVIDGFDTKSLTMQQQEAIFQWIYDGGTLILGTGENFDKSTAAFSDLLNINDSQQNTEEIFEQVLLPLSLGLTEGDTFQKLLSRINVFESTRISILTKNEERRKKYGALSIDTYIGDSILGKSLLSELTLPTAKRVVSTIELIEAETILTENKLPVLEKVRYGSGKILVFHFSILSRARIGRQSDEQIEKMSIYPDAFDLVVSSLALDNLPIGYEERLQNEANGMNADLLAFEIASIDDEERVPKVSGYVWVLGIYVLAVGPVIFFLLKKFRASKYLWAAMPICAGVFTVIIYYMGAPTRIKDVKIGYFDIGVYDEKSGLLNGDIYFDVSMPDNRGTSLTLPGVDQIAEGERTYNSYYETYFTGMGAVYSAAFQMSPFSYQAGVLKDENDVRIEIRNTPAFNPVSFRISYQENTERIPEGNLIFNETGMYGTIKNNSANTLYSSVIYCNGVVTDVGDLAKKATAIVNIQNKSVIAANKNDIYYSDVLDGILGKTNGSTTRKQLRERYAVETALARLAGKDQKAYLVSLVGELQESNPLTNVEEEMLLSGTEVRVYPISVSYQESSNTIFVPNIDSYMKVLDGQYDRYDQYRFMGTDILTMQYNFPEEETIKELIFSGYLNRRTDQEYTNNFVGEIYFHNNYTGQFDLVFQTAEQMFQTQTIGKEHLKMYLSADNQIIMKYKNNRINGSSQLPFLSYRKDITDANN